jgi:hypothetical protein
MGAIFGKVMPEKASKKEHASLKKYDCQSLTGAKMRRRPRVG